jgi:hypothetical protein
LQKWWATLEPEQQDAILEGYGLIAVPTKVDKALHDFFREFMLRR